MLVPLYYRQDEPCLLLILRTENVKEHKGQISFPGGAFEKADGTLLNTVLRESAEEVGLSQDKVDILGELDDEISFSTHYVISPFVGFVPWPYPFKVDGFETEGLIKVPVRALLDKSILSQEVHPEDGHTVYFYHYQHHVIWGATARILNKFLPIVAPLI